VIVAILCKSERDPLQRPSHRGNILDIFIPTEVVEMSQNFELRKM
jgi:hypothetical protein